MNIIIIALGKLLSSTSKLFNFGHGSTWPGHIALETNKNFFLLSLPPYSPDFNVIVRLWQVLRKAVTNNFLFQSLEEVKTAATKFFQFLPSDEVRKICAI